MLNTSAVVIDNLLVYQFLLIFARIGGALMLVPALAESYVNERIRIIIALALTTIVINLLDSLPNSVPSSVISIAMSIGSEFIIGVFFGTVAKLLFNIAHIAGTIISSQSGLSAAMLFDPEYNVQSSPEASLLSITAIAALVMSDFHHYIIEGVCASYELLPLGSIAPITDFTHTISHLVSHIFFIAFKLSAPALVLGVVFYLVNGALARLVPSIQVYFIMLPFQILLFIGLLSVTITSILAWYLGFYEVTIVELLRLEWQR